MWRKRMFVFNLWKQAFTKNKSEKLSEKLVLIGWAYVALEIELYLIMD